MKVNHITKTIINEVDFNRRDVIRKAKTSPIQCGFEVEILWTQSDGIDDFHNGSDHKKRIDSHTYGEISEYISSYDSARLEEGYEMYIHGHSEFDDMMTDAVTEIIETDEFLYNYKIQLAYINREIGLENASDIVTRKFGIESPSESEIVDKIFDLPGVEDELKAELIRNNINELTERLEGQVRDELRDRYDHDHWVEDEFGSMSRMMEFYRIDVVFGDDEMENLMAFVASKLGDWVRKHSAFDSVIAGDTHEHSTPASVKQDFWRVEPDSSITSNNRNVTVIPTEIVSPVYSTVGDMLSEMSKLFDFLKLNSAITNESTGLHVTMSYAGDSGDLNRLKVIALMDDTYLLSKFKREVNGYTLSQKNLLIKELNHAYGGIIDDNDIATTKGLKTLERILSDGYISSDKYRSVHFKGTKNDVGNELVEFRVAGNSDYHTRYDEIHDTVVRYATTILAAHDTELYKRDYLTKLTKLIHLFLKNSIN